MEIMRATISDHMLNFMQNNNPLYRILQPLHDQTATGTEVSEDVLTMVEDLQTCNIEF